MKMLPVIVPVQKKAQPSPAIVKEDTQNNNKADCWGKVRVADIINLGDPFPESSL